MQPSPPPAPDHVPVLPDAATAWLVTDPAGVYVDATFGRGGHTARILQRLAPAGRLFAFDRDPVAAAVAARVTDPRFTFERTRFSRMSATLVSRGIARLHGVLLDLGVSSPQFDDPARGFSLRADGPLDMRMDPTEGESAAQWLHRVDVDELARVIRDYGEERFAVPIAAQIVARREHGRSAGGAPATTADLAALVADTIPVKSRKDAAQHPATRTFQAVRIHVNQELEELALILDQAGTLLVPGGRLVVISFHSLEDRIVKRFIEAHAHPERPRDARAARLPLRGHQLPQPRLHALAKVRPGADEVAANPRARSAVMRVAERTGQPWGHV
jgi:16S rRNA (cytosine1402-N4)-methyltransferase